MSDDVKQTFCWQKGGLTVNVLHSRAGVGQHVLVASDSTVILVDTGDGCLRDLLAAEFRLSEIAALVYTHGHFDHMGGLHSLLGFMRMIGRSAPLPVHAPEGCTEVFATVNNFKRCYPDSVPFPILNHENIAREVIIVGDLAVECYPVEHAGSTATAKVGDPIPAMGYRVSFEGTTVAITGDTGLCDEVRELLSGVDLAVIEATHVDSSQMDREELERVHLSEDVARDLGSLAREYVLVHSARK